MRTAALALILVALAGPSFAAQPVTLRAQPMDADGVVTLGEIFEGAGPAAGRAIATRNGPMLLLSAQVVRAAAARAGLDWPNAEGLRQIAVRGASGATAAAPRANVEALTWARSLSAGEIVQPQDLVWAPVAATPADAPGEPEAVIGKAARRPLRAGAAVTGRDVSAPVVIRAGDVITLSYDNGGVSLSLQAKALAAGAVGETISAQNVTSKKTVQAVVSGPGQALVGPAAEALRLTAPTRIALR
jgi:flagella basal body P-ring formation protein FlgA